MLSNQIRTPLLINWNDANAPVLVMDFAIDAIGAGRRDNIVMCYANPRIVIGNMLAHDSPWTDDPRFHQVFSPVASMGARVVPEMASPKLNEGRFVRAAVILRYEAISTATIAAEAQKASSQAAAQAATIASRSMV